MAGGRAKGRRRKNALAVSRLGTAPRRLSRSLKPATSQLTGPAFSGSGSSPRPPRPESPPRRWTTPRRPARPPAAAAHEHRRGVPAGWRPGPGPSPAEWGGLSMNQPPPGWGGAGTARAGGRLRGRTGGARPRGRKRPAFRDGGRAFCFPEKVDSPCDAHAGRGGVGCGVSVCRSYLT